MDEATTGLDSTTSLQIFRALRIVADESSPVFATLKQPGKDLYELFDNVLVMHDGQIAYYGPCAEMMDYLESAGFSVNRSINPADEVLSLVDERGDELVETFQRSLEEGHAAEKDDYSTIHGSTSGTVIGKGKAKEPERHMPSDTPQADYPQYARSWLAQYLWTVRRGLQIMKNNPAIAISRVMFAVIMSLILGTLFLQLGDENGAISGIQGSLFMVASFPAFQALSALPTELARRPVFYYQRKNHYYQALPNLFADFTVSSPVTIMESVVFATICYWLIGFNTKFERYVYFVLMVAFLEILFSLLTKVVGFLLPTFLVANILVPPAVFMLNFFTGFAVTQDRAPDWVAWIFWVTPFRYLLEGLTINEMVGSHFHCDDDEFIPPSNDPLFNLPYEAGGYEGNQLCPITTGEQVLENNGYYTEYAYAWYWFLVIVGYTVGAFFLMIISSYWTYKEEAPRDLAQAEEKRQQDQLKVQAFKESLRNRSGPIGRRLSRSNLEFSESESNSSSSRPSIFEGLQAQEGGRRIETNVPIVLEWKDVTYTVQVPPKTGIKSKLAGLPCFAPFAMEDLTLLNGVSGYVKPGMLVAFMGPSGAGKTTLLDVLAQRKTAGKFSGNIWVNGAPMDPETLSRFAGYVEQQNIHVETETVEEALLMSASLRLSYPKQLKERGYSHISRKEKLDHILWVMDVLSLTSLRDAMIKELSLEQKKRVTIAVELAANPSLLWLDEPTSGLDAMAALCVMRAIKRIADSGVAVVCTLHQPSELLFSWCTHLLLLAPGGRVVFFGESGDNNHEAKEYFSQFSLAPRDLQNDADFFLDCCSSKQQNESGKVPSEAYKDSTGYQELQDRLEEGIVPRRELPQLSWYQRLLPCFAPKSTSSGGTKLQPMESDSDEERDSREFKQHNLSSQLEPVPPQYDSDLARSRVIQCFYLVTRNARTWWRSPVPLCILVLNSLLFALILSFLFLNMDNSQQGAMEHVSIFFFIALVLTTSVMTYIPQLFEERAALYRETSAKTYHSYMYLVAMIIVNLPLIFISAMIVIVLPWAIAGLGKEWYQVGYLWGGGVMLSMVSYGFILMLSCLAPVAEAGQGLFTIINILNALTNGFLLLRTRIPPWWIWFYWIAYQHYGLEGYLLNELEGSTFHCHDNEGAFGIPVPSEEDPDRVQFYCRFKTGEDVLESVKAHQSQEMVDIIVLGVFVVGLYALSLLIVSKVRHIKR